MNDDDDLPDQAAELGLLIGIIGICSILLALVLTEICGWVLH